MSRKMVKWAPFASLKEQAIVLNKVRNDLDKVEKPTLSEDQISEINNFLVNYNSEQVLIKHYNNGFIYQTTTYIRKIDINNKCLNTEAGTIEFTNLLELNYI